MFWVALAFMVASAVLSQLAAPKIDGPKAADKPETPTTDATKLIPVVFGTVEIPDPALFWWGDYKAVPIKKKIFTGLWFKTVIEGYKYYAGMAFALCYGQLDALRSIRIGDKHIAGVSTGNTSAVNPIIVNQPALYGGDKNGGNGGIKGRIDFMLGGQVGQIVMERINEYLQAQVGLVPAYKGISTAVFRGFSDGSGNGYIGNSATLDGWVFEVSRFPATVGNSRIISGVGPDNVNGLDANPINCIAEGLTDPDWGMGLNLSLLDVGVGGTFGTAWQQCSNEGHGYSFLYDRSDSIENFIASILRQVDGVLYTDLASGKIAIKLARADYVISDIPVLTNDDFIEISDEGRSAYDETTNGVRVLYRDRSKKYLQLPAFAQDLGNFFIQGGNVDQQITYDGCSSAPLAQTLAERDLRALCLPLYRLSGRGKRKAATLTPASVFRYVRADQGIDVVMRVTKVRPGTLQNNAVTIEAVEDVFSISAAVFSSPDTAWTNPVDNSAVAITAAKVIEQPYFISLDKQQVLAAALRSSAQQRDYSVFVNKNAVGYQLDEAAVEFSNTATLVNSYAALTAAVDTSNTLRIDNIDNLSLIEQSTLSGVLTGVNLAMLDDELIAFQSYTDNGDGSITCHSVWRGLLDTVPAAHASGARIWFIHEAAILDTDYVNGDSLQIKPITNGDPGQTSAPVLSVTIVNRSLRPYAPGKFSINGAYTASTIPATGDITATWEHRNRKTQKTIVSQADTGIATEPGTTYTLKIYGEANALVRTETNLSGTSFVYTNAQETTDSGLGRLNHSLTFVLCATRDGLDSLQAQIRVVTRPTFSAPGTTPAYTPSGTYTAPAEGSVVGGIQVIGTPDATNNTLVFNPVTNTYTFGPVGGTLTVKDIDGSPSVSPVNTIKFNNGSVTNEGSGVVRVDITSPADPTVIDLILTMDSEVLVDEISGEVVYYK